MLKHTILTLALVTLATCHEGRKHKVEDPLAALDRHLSHTLAYHYLWPWSQIMRAAAAVADDEEGLEEPRIESDKNMYRVHMRVRRFKPDELSVKVRNRYIIVEGRHKESSDIQQFIANHFIQRLALPPGSKQEEVTAVLNENYVLTVSVPKHELPPPPPEREVPIEVRLSQSSSASPEISSEAIENSSQKTVEASSEKPVEISSGKPDESSSMHPLEILFGSSVFDLVDPSSAKPIESSSAKPMKLSSVKPTGLLVSTTSAPFEDLEEEKSSTHLGKIRKKELKNTSKTTKDNEVTKDTDTNGLDYSLIEEIE